MLIIEEVGFCVAKGEGAGFMEGIVGRGKSVGLLDVVSRIAKVAAIEWASSFWPCSGLFFNL